MSRVDFLNFIQIMGNELILLFIIRRFYIQNKIFRKIILIF